jgi:hypothetical protein
MIRDYADMLWSSYNFWCQATYDKAGCSYEKWTVKGMHERSPELFHDLIVADKANNVSVVQPFYYPMHRPCANAGGYYTEYIDFHVLRYVPANQTMVIASEEMEIAPLKVVQKLAKSMNFKLPIDFDLGNFTKVRINSQEKKGVFSTTPLDHYQPGVYNISDYKPMFNETRKILNECWRSDCLAIAKRTGYTYTACHVGTASPVSISNNNNDNNNNPLPIVSRDLESLIKNMVLAHARDRLTFDLSISNV